MLLFLSIFMASVAWSPQAHAATASSVLSLTVQPYPTQFTVYEVGSTMSHVVASGTDALGPGDPITTTINWGDNTAPTQYTFIDGTSFQISGSHAYSKVGKYTITVTAAVTPFQQSTTGTGTITVVPAYTLHVNNIRSKVTQAFSGTIASGTDPFPNDTLKGSINWGDQTPPTSVQVTSSTNGVFEINTTHTYTTFNPSNSWTITVSLTSIIVGPISGTGAATLAPAFTLSTRNITARTGQAFNTTIATVTGSISARGLLVDIEWGDQTKVSKLSFPGGTNRLQIQGSHTYSQAGSYSFTVIIKDIGTGEQAHMNGLATIR
jgi:hypothetical protein